MFPGLGDLGGQLRPRLSLGSWGGGPTALFTQSGVCWGLGVLGRARKEEPCTHFINGETKAPEGIASQSRALGSRSLVTQGGGRGVGDISLCAHRSSSSLYLGKLG